MWSGAPARPASNSHSEHGRQCAPCCAKRRDASHKFLAAVRESVRHQWFASEQTVACNFAHPIEQRAARWILMMQDQTGRERFPMRAEFISMMLGVPAAHVRAPLAALAELECIRYADEELTVISRDALQEHVCICYEGPP